MPKLPECDRCLLYAHNSHLICAVHPTGVDEDECPDFRINPDAAPEEVWEPIGASYYNGELILQPEQRWSQAEQLQLLDRHPMFTGRCPECEMPILPTYPPLVHWDCAHCGWKDDWV
ncbi:hypothetical protein [Egbenema bharatensis]|uniref:hypothetical protein n=1 Tax=Egbenema bharatensis TaxID=3463334 RepID=UPI003A8B0DCE